MAKRRTFSSDDDLPGEELASDEAIPLTEDTLSNAAEVPLFANSSFANNKSIAKLKLVKLDNPGAGYKGEIAINSTLETIGQLFGDGLYNIEAVNSSGRRLRVLENQRIALGIGPNDSVKAPPAEARQTSDVERIERLALKSANESVQQAQSFRDLVVATTNASAQREREFMQGVQAQSQAFMASLMTAQSQGFAQLLTLMQTGHQQTVELLGAARRNSGDENSGERLIAMFLQGMNTGRGLESQEPEPFWQEILRGGANLLAGAKQAQLQAANPVSPVGATSSSTPKKLRRLLAAMRKRGIDSDTLLGMLEGGAPQPSARESEVDSGDSEPEDQDGGPGQSVFFGAGDTQGDTQ